MLRRIRIEKRLLLELADGSTLTIDPGDCWIDDDADMPTITWNGPGGLESSPILAAEVNTRLSRRDFVFTSW